MGRKKRKQHAKGGGGPPHHKKKKHKNKKAKFERYWVEDCGESNKESFDNADVQLLITRVELFTLSNGNAAAATASAAAVTKPDSSASTGVVLAASSKIAAAGGGVAAAGGGVAAAGGGVAAATFKHEEPISCDLVSEAMKVVSAWTAQASMKEPPNIPVNDANVSSSKDKPVEEEDSKPAAVPLNGGCDKDDGDKNDNGDKRHKKPTIGIRRDASAKGPAEQRPKSNSNKPFCHLPNGDCGDGILNPHPKSEVADKYWAQRKHLFSRYDDGIELDSEGWYSVTPEAIANHIAKRMVDECSSSANAGSSGMIVLDAFAGVGGNSIAFARHPNVNRVVCVDSNQTRLRMAAKNCRVYNIPKEKVVFIHGDAVQVLACFEKGKKLQTEKQQPPAKQPANENVHGYQYGGMELLPDRLDAIFLSPPWGGSDYGDVGRRHYDLACIRLISTTTATSAAPADGTPSASNAEDSRSSASSGKELLELASKAVVVGTRNIAYFLPRNTNGQSVAYSASKIPGIRHLEMEQNYLNFKLKTITIYASSRSSQQVEKGRYDS